MEVFLLEHFVHSLSVDNITGNVVVDGGDYDENGSDTDVSEPTGRPSGTILAIGAENALACGAQPSSNNSVVLL